MLELGVALILRILMQSLLHIWAEVDGYFLFSRVFALPRRFAKACRRLPIKKLPTKSCSAYVPHCGNTGTASERRQSNLTNPHVQDVCFALTLHSLCITYVDVMERNRHILDCPVRYQPSAQSWLVHEHVCVCVNGSTGVASCIVHWLKNRRVCAKCP